MFYPWYDCFLGAGVFDLPGSWAALCPLFEGKKLQKPLLLSLTVGFLCFNFLKAKSYKNLFCFIR